MDTTTDRTDGSRPATKQPPSPAIRRRIIDGWAQARHLPRPDADAAWALLEEAHVLAQPDAWLHLRTHAEMLRLAVRTRDRRELLGQAVRLVVAGPGSLTGRYPVGNTGRSDVSMFRPMPIPDDVAELMAEGRG